MERKRTGENPNSKRTDLRKRYENDGHRDSIEVVCVVGRRSGVSRCRSYVFTGLGAGPGCDIVTSILYVQRSALTRSGK